MNKTERFEMRIDKELKAALQKEAESENRKLSSHITNVLINHLNKIEHKHEKYN